ncbi:hypothetical protein KAR91_52930 [Candidatus Pacearchaeota archaeon]|nr:hypothetical protein [Candidatus Pacearchaeota archaeon]
MNGDCGVFYVGDRQVGGCYKWSSKITLGALPGGKWANYKVTSKTITSERWWLYEDVTAFKIVLYWVIDGNLVYANSADIKSIVAPKVTEYGEEQAHELIMKF